MAIDTLIVPFEALRRELWRLTARTELGRRCIREPALRLQLLAIGHIAVAATLALVAPAWLLLLAPLLLGVPHIASDIRYLVVRAPFRVASRALFLIPLATMVLARLLAWLGMWWSARLEISLGLGAMVVVLMLAPLSRPRRLGALGAVALAWVLLWDHASSFLLVFAHAHNVVAIAAWLALYRKEAPMRRVISVSLAWLAAVAVIMVLPLATLNVGPQSIGAFSLGGLASALAPGLDADLAMRLVGLFAFAQSVHYAIWLRLVPQSFDDRPAPPTLDRSWSRLRTDFGARGLGILVVVTLGVPLLALVWDAEATRQAYLTAAVFHGWLELAIFGALLAGAGGFTPARAGRPPEAR